MTVAKAIPLQIDVYAAVSVAVAPIEVFDHVPTNPPDEFIRLEGFELVGLGFKNGEAARHSFEVHHFLRPTSDKHSLGQGRTKQIIALAHEAIMSATLVGTKAHFEYSDVDSDEDGVSMHGRARYTITL